MQLGVGQSFAEYTLDGLLGQGGMGRVYLARHPRLPRQVALKLLAPEVSADQEVRRRFEQEANAIARLDHPSIVGVHDRGMIDGQLWIAMQYVAGTDASRLNPREVSVPRALRIIAETASALDFAHSRGVLHRDVKPANILLSAADTGREERAILTDFGIARLLDSNTQLTATGTFAATLAFAAPELLSGEAVDHRADQYSLGCTLFTILAGHPPFASANPGQVVAGHLSKSLPRLGSMRTDVPPFLDDVIARATAKRREDRFASCTEFAVAAFAALSGHAPPVAPSAPTVVWPQSTNPYQPGGHDHPAPPEYVPGPRTGLRPAAIAAAVFAAAAAFIATAGAIRLYTLYADQKARIAAVNAAGHNANTNYNPLTYLGVGTITAAVVALLLFAGVGQILARKHSGRVFIVLGAVLYTLGALLGRTTDNRPFEIYGLAIETAVCVLGAILAIIAAGYALAPSAVSVTDPAQIASVPVRSRVLLIATGCAAIVCAILAAFVTYGFSNQITYSPKPITCRVLMVAAAVMTLLLFAGGIALLARIPAGRFMVAAGGTGLLGTAATELITRHVSTLPLEVMGAEILPYFQEPLATVIYGAVAALSLLVTVSALSKVTGNALR